MRKPASPEELKKGPWTAEEDEKLVEYIRRSGHGSWRALPKLAGLNRCGKSCRLRWTNYLRPDIKRGNFSPQEEHLILKLHSLIGNKWSAIAARLPGRTDNEIKNFWNTHMRKKLLQMGIDPVTHRPRTDLDFLISNLPPPLSHLLPNLSNTNLPTLNAATINPHNLNALKLLLHAAGDPTQLAKINLLHNILQNLTAVAPPQPPLTSLHGHGTSSLPPLSFQGLGTGPTADSGGINDRPAGFDDNYFHQPAAGELIMASINSDNCNGGNNGDDQCSDHLEFGNYGSGCDHTTNMLSTAIPALISESPEDSSIATDQSEKNGACLNGKSKLSCGSVGSFEANWGELLLHDDDAMCNFPYYWKENIIDETSSPSWLMPS